ACQTVTTGPIHEGLERSADAPVRVSPIAAAADSSRGHPRDTRTRASALLRELALPSRVSITFALCGGDHFRQHSAHYAGRIKDTPVRSTRSGPTPTAVDHRAEAVSSANRFAWLSPPAGLRGDSCSRSIGWR